MIQTYAHLKFLVYIFIYFRVSLVVNYFQHINNVFVYSNIYFGLIKVSIRLRVFTFLLFTMRYVHIHLFNNYHKKTLNKYMIENFPNSRLNQMYIYINFRIVNKSFQYTAC